MFCFGSMEIPKMTCPKEIYNKELGYSSLKCVVRRNALFTPIKVLLVNGDMPVEVVYVNIEYGSEIKLTIPRDRVTIQANSRSLLDIKAQVNLPKDDDGKPKTFHKLLIGSLKECELKFRLILEILVI